MPKKFKQVSETKQRKEVTMPAENNRLLLFIPVAVAALTFIVFLPALKDGFVNWDDDKNFLGNYLYRGLGWEQLKWMFTTFHTGPYQPLSWITYGLDYLVWGMDPFGYHLTNVLLHSANAALFYLLCLRLFSSDADTRPPENKTALHLSAAFAALFFSLHPLRAESVAWATERRDVLSGLFYLLTLFLYLSPRAPDGERTSVFGRRAPLAAFLLALLSKAIVITLPVALVILDVFRLKRLPPDPRRWLDPEYRRVWQEKIPYFALSLFFGVVGYVGQASAGALVSLQKAGPAGRAAQTLYSVGLYLWKTMAPVKLIPFYKFSGGLFAWQALLGGAAALAITAGVVKARRRLPALPAVWLFYLITLGPVSGIVKFGEQAAADRYTYLPCLGFAALAGWALLAGLRGSRQAVKKAAVPAACLIVLLFGRLSWAQAQIWHDSETLWKYVISINPRIEFVRTNLAAFFTGQGRLEEAVSQCGEALRINPGYESAHNNLGVALARQGKTGEAILSYQEALRLRPGYTEVFNNLGNAFAAQGDLDEAERNYRSALLRNPGYANAHNGLGAVFARQGKREEAVEQFREALRLNPDLALARKNLELLAK